jgi:limonene-1,2-epoxide hydrolase
MSLFYEQNYFTVTKESVNGQIMLRKRLKDQYQEDKYLCHELGKEANKLLKIQHKHIAAASLPGSINEAPSMLIACPEGETLAQAGGSYKNKYDELRVIFLQLLDAMNGLHSQHVALKHLKPELCLLHPTEGLTILPLEVRTDDFTEDHLAENLRQTAALVLWLATGQSESAHVQQISDAPLAKVLAKCLHPTDHYRNAAEACNDLLNFADTQTTQRKRHLAIGLAALVGFLLIGASWWGWSYYTELQQAEEVRQFKATLKEEEYAAEIAHYGELIGEYQGLYFSNETGKEVVVRVQIHQVDTLNNTFTYTVLGRGSAQKQVTGELVNDKTISLPAFGIFGFYKNKNGKVVLETADRKAVLLAN